MDRPPLPTLTDQEILSLRPAVLRPEIANQTLGHFLEDEPNLAERTSAETLTILLRGSECRFRCLMCDLWKYTYQGKTPVGSIPQQIKATLEQYRTRDIRWIKLYNASNFFSPTNVPREDLAPVAALVSKFQRVIVENHPKLLTDDIERFRDALSGKLEIAMGLETIHADVLAKLNKRMHLDDFRRASEWLLERDIDFRVFVLLRPPGMDEQTAIEWCHKSIEFAGNCGARHISVIPVRSGNGALQSLAEQGHFAPPQMSSLESVVHRQLQQRPLYSLTADLWDWEKLPGSCEACRNARHLRLQAVNLSQDLQTWATLPECGCALGGPKDATAEARDEMG